MNMSIPKMNKNAVFIKNFTFRLRNISYLAKRGISDSFPKENEVFNRRHRVAACQRQALYHTPRTVQHIEQRSLGS